MVKKTKLIHAHDISSLYPNAYMISRFHNGIRFSITRCEDNVIIEPYLEKEMAPMDTSDGPSSSYFYLNLPVIHKMRVLTPFTIFEIDFLTTVNVAPSQITPNI